MENVEIKIRLDGFAQIQTKLGQMRARKCGVLVQCDTYFTCPEGRLKLREFPGKPAQLIFYRRLETGARRLSQFHILRVPRPDEFKAFIRKVLPVKVVVSKRRILYYFKSARIHLDRVRGLGTFLEIESEVRRGRASARKLLGQLLKDLGISAKDCIRQSYSDLLLAKTRR